MVSLEQQRFPALSCAEWQFRYVSKHFTFESPVVALDFLLIAQIIVQLLCLQHVWPSPLWVFAVWLNEGQNKSLSWFRQYMYF